MQWLQDLIPIEYLIVAAVILAVLFVVTVAFRVLAGRGSGAESSRLAVSEVLDIDRQRRLILVRRDDVEHLVLVGGGQDVLLESAVRPGVQRREDAPASPRILPSDRLQPEPERAPAAARHHGATRPVPLRAARPPVFGDSAPAPAQTPPEERTEPRLEALKTEDRSREA